MIQIHLIELENEERETVEYPVNWEHTRTLVKLLGIFNKRRLLSIGGFILEIVDDGRDKE